MDNKSSLAATPAIAAAAISIEQKQAVNATATGAQQPGFKRVDSVMTDSNVPSTAMDSGVRVLGRDEWKRADATLAEAFAEDDTMSYFLDTPAHEHWTKEQKWNLHAKTMEYITYAHLLKGQVLSVGPNYECISLWMPPGANMDDMLTAFRSGLWRLRYQLCREGRKRFFDEFMPLLHDTKSSVMGERDNDSWYLVYLGTKSSARGKGYARKVIEHVSRIANRNGKAMYLESSHRANEGFYGRMGFVERREIHMHAKGDKKVRLCIMVREPQAAGKE